MKVTDTESFIDKARLVHGDKYNYDKVEYVKTALKVIIHCPKHGDFEQTPNKHLSNRGCYHCGREIVKSAKKLTLYDFIYKSNEVHNNKYDYSLVEYKNNNTKVKIICLIHGVFEQRPMSHLKRKGCSKCNGGVNKEKQEIIDIFKKVHGDKYDYSLVKYINNSKKVKIICKEHGVFKQSPSNHSHKTNPQGCPKCALKIKSKQKQENPIGWNVTNWEIASKKSKNFDSFKVYIIKCWNESEEFYKIGRTFTTTKNRFKSTNEMPYKYEIIKEFIFDNAKEAFNKEVELKRFHKEHKYTPNIKFYGMSECFTQIII